MRYYPDTYYMSVWEKFTAINGEPSLYTRMFGSGHFTCRLAEDSVNITKQFLKNKVEEILSEHTSLDDFTVTETDYGWNYERFVKWLDEDGFEYELVDEGQHTDHELYTVELSIYREDYDAFKKL